MLYTNINVKSHYTLLKSSIKIDDLISFALNDKQKYICLCDENFLGGSIELLKKCESLDIIPIIALEVQVEYSNQKYSLLVYAKNLAGYHQLMLLSSYIMENQTIDFETFNSFISDDLIIVIDLYTSEVYKEYLLNNNINQELIDELKQLFSTDYCFIKDNGDSEAFKLQISNHGLKLLAANPIYTLAGKQKLVYLLECLANSKSADELEMLSYEKKLSLINEKNATNYYTNDELNNLNDFLKLFEKYSIHYQNTLPNYCDNPSEKLKRLALKGLEKRLNYQVDDIYLKRLEYELKTIFKMGYENYFLIVYDYVLFAKKSNILVGPGRGSAAGSLVSYCLGITDVDPIINQLFFERFLNPERISMPDIDIDFEDTNRQEIIEYLKDKYGQSHVGHILTYNTFQTKNSLRDFAKILNIPNHQMDLILKLFPEEDIKLSDFKKHSKQLLVYLNQYPNLAQLYELAMQAQGMIRNYSTHAAGIIITKEPLEQYVPVMPGISDTLMIQYTMHYLEDIALYKMDILGIKNLSTIKEIISKINPDFRLDKIPLNDAKTLELINLGKTIGVFQFESEGVVNFLKKMNIKSIDDLMVATALYRPGPMKFIDEYLQRSSGSKNFNYLHPSLKPILESTYGIIVYQEQIMQITQVMAGFSLAKADLVRKAMSKKNESILKAINEEFIDASINNGYTPEVANQVFAMILEFANYGFNKAHAYSYALLGYYMAYLKAHYPKEFYQTILSANINNEKKLNTYIYEVMSLGFAIKVPNLNKSTIEFEVEDNSFILPFNAIKGLGSVNAKAIIEERNNNGLYLNYVDSVVRLVVNKIDEKIIRSLIAAGAFDDFEESRTTMLENLSQVYDYAKLSLNKEGLFVDDAIELGNLKIYANNNKIIQKEEFEVLGLYLSSHPLDIYRENYPDSFLKNIDNNKVLVMVDKIKEIRTKKGELMAFVSVGDKLEFKTLVIFPNVYQRVKNDLQVNDIILVKGRVDEKNIDNIIVQDIQKLNGSLGSDN